MKATFACAGLAVAIFTSANGAEFKFNGQTLTVPDGFEVELVASTNLVERPISIDFDETGRLYATDSSGSNEKVTEQLEKKPHRVVRLEDSDHDGRFDKTAVFADQLMFPEGCLWFDGSLYVSAPPSIWKLTDTNSDGVVDVRQEWHQGKTLTGCANDLHGPYLGPDGFIYWCKGAFAEQTYEINGKPFTTKASHIFRALPDHSRMESVMTGGMDNPVGIAFSPTGERFLAGTFFEPGGGLRDGVIHAIYGGVYGKPHPDVLEGHKRTGDLMPVMVHLGPSASASVISYRSGELGEQYRDNLFVANFNLHNVTRHILKPQGATFTPEDHVFLSSDNPDFHPTCVLEDADGSVLVVDTGGWYKICCPTSQLYKPDMLGAIYRIRRKGAHKIEDPRGLKIDWQNAKPKELTKFLDDKRPFVVTRAIQQIARQKNESIPALAQVAKKSKSEEARRNAMWALTQIDSPEARQAVRASFPAGPNSHLPPEDSAMQVAIYSIALWRDSKAIGAPAPEDFPAVVGMSDALQSENPFMCRIAAEAWGRVTLQKDLGVRHLLGASKPFDRILEHSFAYALIELNDPKTTAEGLTNLFAQRIALIALDQMDNGGLKPEQVATLMLSTNAEVKQTASSILGRHPGWGGALGDLFAKALTKESTPSEETILQKQLAQLASDGVIQNLLATNAAIGSKRAKLIALRAMAQAGLKPAPQSWGHNLAANVPSDDAKLIEQVVATARALSFDPPLADLTLALLHVAKDNYHTAETRLSALAALPVKMELAEELFNFCRDNLQPTKAVSARGSATAALIKTKLSDEQLLSLTDVLKTVGPLEIIRLLDAFERSTNEALGLKLVSTLKQSKSVSSLRAENVKPKLAKFPASVQQTLEEFLKSLNADAGKQAAHVDQLLASLKGGDIRRGQAVFNSPKAACASCHAIGYGGGHVGPDLTRIGQVRSERDLLEAIVYPSASFVRSYESMIVMTKSGDDYSGVMTKDNAEEVVLVTGPNSEVKIPRKDIAEMRPGALSVMPQGLDEQLTKQELADLVAFLKATRW